jgi:UvrD-like helicase C-terminal domain
MVIDFDGRPVTYGFGELGRWCSLTRQPSTRAGSEYPAVVIPLATQHYPMLQRNLLYTAVTRGKRLVVIVGQKKAMAIAVKGKQTRRRWSKLATGVAGGGIPVGRSYIHRPSWRSSPFATISILRKRTLAQPVTRNERTSQGGLGQCL